MNTFEALVKEWMGKFGAGWAPGHLVRVESLFERDIFPTLGPRPIADIKAPEMLSVVRRIEARGALDTAQRALGSCSQVVGTNVPPKKPIENHYFTSAQFQC